MEALCRRRIFIIKKSIIKKPVAKKLRKCIIVMGWLAVWHIIALAVDNEILMAAPAETAGRILSLLGRGSFYAAAGRSLLRIALGFFAGTAARSRVKGYSFLCGPGGLTF